jgi:hypothetical protein
LPRFDLGVFFTAVVLPGHFDNAAINQLIPTSRGKNALLVEGLIEPEKQHFDQFFLNQRFPEFADCFAVGNRVAGL